MMFITGPLYSGKRTFARNFRGSIIADVQDAAAETQTPEQLETLARAAVLSRWMLRSAPGGRPPDGWPACWQSAPTAWCRCSAASRRY